jgi:hypothetical protein
LSLGRGAGGGCPFGRKFRSYADQATRPIGRAQISCRKFRSYADQAMRPIGRSCRGSHPRTMFGVLVAIVCISEHPRGHVCPAWTFNILVASIPVKRHRTALAWRCGQPLRDHHIADFAMVRISMTPEAFEAVVATLPLGCVGYEPELNSQGERRIWIEAAVADRVTAMRRRGESYSDVILRLVEMEGPTLLAVCEQLAARLLSAVCRQSVSNRPLVYCLSTVVPP